LTGAAVANDALGTMNNGMQQAEPTIGSIEVPDKLRALREKVRDLGSVIVCFSGGLDSGLVLAVATEQLGERAIALTATGPALAPSELNDASQFAETLGARHVLRDAGELSRPGYVANGPDRCFHCKSALYATARELARELGVGAVANGTNLDDLGDYRPGLEAARDAGIVSPLLDVGMTKADVRKAAKALALPLWDKPAAACLASRLPYGTEVTPERLAQIAGFEAELRGLGFERLRVRHHGAIARIEVDVGAITKVTQSPWREQVLASGHAHGFAYVVLDLAGYRMGSHNEVLDGKHLRTVP